eukprot:s85_g11.t1
MDQGTRAGVKYWEGGSSPRRNPVWLLLSAPLRGVSAAQWPSLRTEDVVDAAYMRRLDCADSKNWTAFRHLLVSKMEAGYVLGQDFELQEAAEGLLAYADATGGEVQEELGKEFFAKLGTAQEEPGLFPGLPGRVPGAGPPVCS